MVTDAEQPSAAPEDSADVWPGRPYPLGATCQPEGTNFALWSREAQAVELCLIDEASDGTLTERRMALPERASDVWFGFVPGVRPGQQYGYRVHGPWAPERGDRFNPDKLLIDPYAKALHGEFVPDDAVLGSTPEDDLRRDDRDSAPYVPRSVVVDATYDWGGDVRPGTALTDSVIYEMHVKGFTRLHPGVPEHLRGTYAGLAHPAAIEHLTGLGITAVELLPVQAFLDEIPLLRRGLVNYWGYNSIGFFAPEARYCSGDTRGGQVDEFRDMVKALHAAGIEVILDVVYNHTAEGNSEGPTVSFRGIDNASYYRLHSGVHYTDVTGCGNTLDASAPQVVQLVLDSLRYWVEEMHVDGFRFDLATALARSRYGEFDPTSAFLTAARQDPVLSQVKLIAEPWDVGLGGYQVGRFPPPFAEWNDRFRQGVRDFWRGAGASVRELSTRLAGSSDLYGRRGPAASLNYVTSHDGFTLRDLVSYEHKHNEANGEGNRDGSDDNSSSNCGVEGDTDDAVVLACRGRRARNLLTTLLLSTGVPMLVAGDEMGRTQHGNNNAYCQDNDLSWLHWDLSQEQQSMLAFTRELLRLRNTHPVLRRRSHWQGTRSRPDGPKDVTWYGPEGREATSALWHDSAMQTLGMLVSGDGLRERGAHGEPIRDRSFLFIAHSGGEPAKFSLPDEQWVHSYAILLDTATCDTSTSPALQGGDLLELVPGSAILLEVELR